MKQSKNNWTAGNVRFIVALFLLSLFLGLISFHLLFPDFSFFRKLYLTLQLFTLESGDRFHETDFTLTLPLKILFNTARLMAAITTVYAIVITIFTFLGNWNAFGDAFQNL